MTVIDKRFEVFISYAHTDNPEPEYPITQLVALLKETYRDRYGEDIRVFFDVDGLKPGELWENKLLESLRQSAIMIVVLSSDYYKSEYCYKEWRHFQDVEIHYSLPGAGIIANKFSKYAHKQGSITPLVNIWIQDLSKRQYCDISDWKTNQNTETFRRRLINVCEQIYERKLRLEERKRIVSNVRPHNVNFTGRSTEIRQIHDALIQSSVGVITAIKGIGGIGKSTIAYEYAHAYIDYYIGGTFNFNAEGQDDFRIALASIAAMKGIEFTEEERKNLDLQCQRVWRIISQGMPALLILDNVNKPDILKHITDYAPDRHKLHILITSRQGFVAGKSIKEFRVPPLGQSLSLDLLLKLFPAKDNDEWKAANAITFQLGGHPLALTMVGVYLTNKEDMSYAIQLQWLEDEGIEALDIMSEGISLDDYAKPVPTQIFGQVFSLLSPVEMRVLEYAALLPPDSIPLPWIFELLKEDFPEIVPDPQKPYRNPWNDLVLKLERLQLTLPSIGEPRIVSMHRLMQDAIRKRHDRNQQNLNHLIDYISKRAEFIVDIGWLQYENRWEIDPLVAFSLQLLSEDNIHVVPLANITIYHNLGEMELELGNVKEAKRLFEKSFEFYKEGDPTILFYYYSLGKVELELGNLLKAKLLSEKAIEICEEFSDKDDLQLLKIEVISYSNLGRIERELENFTEAKRLYKRAIEISKKYFENDHPFFVTLYHNLGDTERALGNYQEAKRLIEISNENCVKHFGLDNPIMSSIYSNCGNVEFELGNIEEAKRLFELSVEIHKKYFDPEHPDLAKLYSNLGETERKLGNFQQAKRLFEKTIDIIMKHFGLDYPKLELYYSNLGNVELELDNIIEAKRHFERAIAINKKRFKPDYPNLAILYSNLGDTERNLGNLENAAKLFQKAIEILKYVSPNHPYLLIIYSHLYDVQEDLDDAERDRYEQ